MFKLNLILHFIVLHILQNPNPPYQLVLENVSKLKESIHVERSLRVGSIGLMKNLDLMYLCTFLVVIMDKFLKRTSLRTFSQLVGM